MKFKPTYREFKVGHESLRTQVTNKECGFMDLQPEELITFTTPDGGQYDVTRKSWGFYATPSNVRLAKFGLSMVVIRDITDKYFVLIVEKGHEEEFNAYMKLEGHQIVEWLK